MTEPEPETLVRVVAPHFVAALVVVQDRVTVAAPILAYMRGWTGDRVRTYVARKGWRASIVGGPIQKLSGRI